ncbi:MAG: MFS transporter [Burkholderiaceae bacterium]
MSSAISAPCDSGIAAAARLQQNRYPRATLAACILGSSLAFIDGSVINIALPALGRALRAGPAELAWTINAYLLPLGALILLGGSAGDHFGRRKVFLLGLAIFTTASMLCAAASTLPWLLTGRALQGVGAALLMPNSLAILGASFSGEKQGRAIGLWAAMGALAGALGPLVGGWLIDLTSWRSIFVLNLPIAAAALYLAWKYVPESSDRRASSSLDWTGAALVTAALGSLTWALTAASESNAQMSMVGLVAAAAVALLAAFVWIEARRGPRAIMPLALFARSSFLGLTLLTFFLYASLGGVFVLVPYLLIEIAGYSAVAAGAALLPLPIVIAAASPLMGRMTARYGGRRLLTTGAAIVTVGIGLYLRIGSAAIDYWTDVLPATLVVAIGMGVTVAPLTATVMAAVDADHVGAASGLNSAVARIGGLIATALLGFVFSHQGSVDGLVASFRIAVIVGTTSAAMAAVCALVLIRASTKARR